MGWGRGPGGVSKPLFDGRNQRASDPQPEPGCRGRHRRAPSCGVRRGRSAGMGPVPHPRCCLERQDNADLRVLTHPGSAQAAGADSPTWGPGARKDPLQPRGAPDGPSSPAAGRWGMKQAGMDALCPISRTALLRPKEAAAQLWRGQRHSWTGTPGPGVIPACP